MHDPYRTMLRSLLPLISSPLVALVACTGASPDDTGKTGDTSDTATPTSEQGCYTLPADTTTCPEAAAITTDEIIPETCGATVLSIDGAGTVGSCGWIGGVTAQSWCIYPITVIAPSDPCDYGRPLVLAGAPRLAPLRAGTGWATAPRPAASGSSSRAATWARIALAEHASVASFSRFALQLLAAGAPADLVRDAHAAALDEVRHAQLAFGLAARAGVPLAPGPLALGDLTVSGDLAALAAATVREGCVAETLSALQMTLAQEHTDDPAERAALAVIARDEARHAELAWRTVRWALTTGGPEVRAAVEAALSEVPSLPDSTGGLLPLEVARASIERGWREVIVPAGRALLGEAVGVEA